MAFRDHDSNSLGGGEGNMRMLVGIAAAVISGLILLFIMAPRSDEPNTTAASKAPTNTTTKPGTLPRLDS